ncbi:sensor histidine kinase [Nocardioides pelophilus]|uniref:sensor histidine kinase n=1 Tax=Nocardioides pelophilus TaxID=2172019 RepID=UPI0028B0FC49|nr:HAMP domain-containing sensor histidine kinase [Nocardioides pelophilus]
MIRLPRSLTSRLVLTTVALVAAVSALIAIATTIAMHDHLTDQLDRKVQASTGRALGGPGGHDDARRGPRDVGNQEPGTLVLLPAEDVGFVLTDRPGEELLLTDEMISTLLDVPSDGDVHEVELPKLGAYRVAVADNGSIVTGLPTDEVDDAVQSLIRWELALGALAVVLAAVAGTALVRRQLRPLTEVARTAHAVAERPLDSGEIGVTERVPDHLTDPDTEVGQVGQALNTLLAHVESSLDARHRSELQVRQFVADASHELRTPLTTIVGYAELARRRQDPEATATALAKVEEEAARMTTLVEDLLLLARLDSGRPLAQEPVDLTRLLLEAVEDARVLAPDHRWHLELATSDEDGGAVPVEVIGDAARLHQVVTNLLTNARKYTPPGTTVTVAVHGDGFEVRDDGPGFPPDLLPVAFERFSRGDASRHREGGVGLGLALVQAIVAAHGGTVTLTSEPGDTRVRVAFPS